MLCAVRVRIKSNELLEEGKKVYAKARCGACHGQDGRGFWPSAGSLKDDRDHPIHPLLEEKIVLYAEGL
jgi:cytochrome c